MTYHLTINGATKSGNASFSVANPSGGVAGEAPNATLNDLNDAVSAASEAFKSWSQKPGAKLREACKAVTAKINEHAEELAQIVTAEQGKPLNGLGSRWELGGIHCQLVAAG